MNCVITRSITYCVLTDIKICNIQGANCKRNDRSETHGGVLRTV